MDRGGRRRPGIVTMGRTKGTHVVQLIGWLRENVASKDLASVEELASQRGLSGALVNLWYDIDDVMAVFHEGARLTGKTVREVARGVAKRNASVDLRGVHRIFLRYSATTWSLGLLPALWRAYFDFGAPRVVLNERGRFRLDTMVAEEYVEWVAGGWEGFLLQMAVLTGATSPRLEVRALPAAAGAVSRTVRSDLTYGAHADDFSTASDGATAQRRE
jgi:hypothetical protein